MLRMKKSIKLSFLMLVLLFLVILAACATVPTSQEMAVADHGQPPTNIEAQLTYYLRLSLKDPDSLKNLIVGVPKKGWARSGNGFIYGYWVDFSYNAKNSYGGYVGQKGECSFFHNGLMTAVFEGRECPR